MRTLSQTEVNAEHAARFNAYGRCRNCNFGRRNCVCQPLPAGTVIETAEDHAAAAAEFYAAACLPCEGLGFRVVRDDFENCQACGGTGKAAE